MILVFGTICIDRLRRVPRLPEAGGYIEIQDEMLLLGGEAANTANALVRWGAEVLLAGNSLGEEEDSRILAQLLHEKNLPLLTTGAQHGPTPVCDIYITPDGERTMFGKGFSSMAPETDLKVLPYKAGQWFTAEPNMGTVAREAVREAGRRGMKIYLMDFIREDDPIEEGSFWQASTDWAGHRNNTQKNVLWVRNWVERFGCFTILSDGPNGFVAGSPNHPVRAYPPYPAPAILDTTGAGDMFRAGMLYGLENGWPIADSLRFAAAAGCLKCQYLGATTGVPTKEAVVAHIDAHPEISRAYV